MAEQLKGAEMTIEERVEKLERESTETKADLTTAKRRNRWMLGGAALLILSCLTIAATPGDKQIIRAQQVIVVDDLGRECAMLGVNKDVAAFGANQDGPRLKMYDESGKERAEMGVNKDGPGLAIYDELGTARAALGVNRNGSMLGLADELGTTRAALGVNKDGPMLSVADKLGKTIWQTPR